MSKKLAIVASLGSTGSVVVTVAVGMLIVTVVAVGAWVGGTSVGPDILVNGIVTGVGSPLLQATASRRIDKTGNNSSSFGFQHRRWSMYSPPSFSNIVVLDSGLWGLPGTPKTPWFERIVPMSCPDRSPMHSRTQPICVLARPDFSRDVFQSQGVQA